MAEPSLSPTPPVTLAVAADVEAETLRRWLRHPRVPTGGEERDPRGPLASLVVAGVGRAGDPALERSLPAGSGTVLNPGLAGALAPDLEPGEIVLTSGWVDPDPPHDPVAEPDATARAWLRSALETAGLAVRSGAGITVREPFHDAAARDRVHRACGALTVEMEGARWADIARKAGHAFAAVRVISDRADLRLPLPRHLLLDTAGGVRWGPWLRALGASGWVRLPAELGRLRRARAEWLAALGSLDAVAAALVDALASPDLGSG